MLPPGHVAGGFLAGYALLKVTKPELAPAEYNQLLFWAMFFGFAPDIDNFFAFAKVKSWWYKQGMDNTIHRRFFTHFPILWMLAGLAVYFFAQSEYYKYFGLIIWVASWSHFLLDSISAYGIEWLWPFSKKVCALKNSGVKSEIVAESFVEYWWKFTKKYLAKPEFYIEVLLILTAIIIYFRI